MSQDYGVITAPDTVKIERMLPGPIERVWAYLTEPTKRATWFAGGPMDLRPGGAMTLEFNNNGLTAGDDPPSPKYEKYGGHMSMDQQVTACEPPRLLVFTFGEGSEVQFELTPRGKQVLLVLTHRRIPNRGFMLSVSGGWHTHLELLVAHLEGRELPKFWRTHTKIEAEYDKRIPASM